MRTALPAVLLLATSLVAQDEPEPRFRIAIAASIGTFELDQDVLDDDTDAGLFRLQFEYISSSRLGGGVRIESYASDDDLFGGANSSEATNGSIFGHFTYRLGRDRFEMPVRAGLLASNLTIEQNATGIENEAMSLGPYLELAPELTLIRVGPTRWTIYGEFGAGFAVTQIEIDGVSEEFDSDSLFYGVEVGTRVGLGMFEVGLGFLARFQVTDDSDVENGLFVPEFDTTFEGVLLSAALRF
jgi:hypothetical protein